MGEGRHGDAMLTATPFERARDLVREARRVVVFTGAGLSTESGIPDFRSPGGLWTRFDPQEFHLDRFLADPRRFWELRADLMAALDLPRVQPNAAHRAIAGFEATGRLRAVVTQNIDDLHEKAGTTPERLLKVHGSATLVRCIACEAFFPFEVAASAVAAGRLPPACPACGGILKPGTVLFGEGLPEDVLAQAYDAARTCDLMLVVGSSLRVWPAADLPRAAVDAGARLVIVNREPTPMDALAHAVLAGSAGDVVPRLFSQP